MQEALDHAGNTLALGDIDTAVNHLQEDLGSDRQALREAVLLLLDQPSLSSELKQGLLGQVLARQPDFNAGGYGTEGRKPLDLVLEVAVRHADRALARYVMDKGGDPQQASLVNASGKMHSLLTRRRRQNLLYAQFEGGNGQELTDLDRFLQTGRHEEVRQRLDVWQKNHNTGMRQLWDDSMARGRKDILRAILIVGTRKELTELTKQQHRVGEWVKAVRDDPGLSAALKEFPYLSSKGRNIESLNAAARFAGTAKRIVCRHLAFHHQEEQARDPGRIKFDYGQFASPEAITRNVKQDIEKKIDSLIARAENSYLIDNKKFGAFIARQFEEMEREKKPSRLMLVYSINHAMNLGLRIKEDKDGKKAYVAKFFDPNRTTHGTRSKANSPRTFELQTIGNYVEQGFLPLYFPRSEEISMIFVRPEGKGREKAGSDIGKTLNLELDAKDLNITAISHLIVHGFGGNLRQLREHIDALPLDQRIKLLSGKSDEGFPAISEAMKRWADVIRAYGELLESIPEDRRLDLIRGKNDKGFIPAFHVGMSLGNTEGVKAYMDVLKKLMGPDKQAELLLERVSEGARKGQSGLDIAVKEHEFGAVKEVLSMLKELVPQLKQCPDKLDWMRKEMKGYEESIPKARFSWTKGGKVNREYWDDYAKMQETYKSLMKALSDEDASGKSS